MSLGAIVLLPRQFHVSIVENRNERDVRTAGWLFPLYLVLINIFVIPIVIAGLAMFPDGAINRDMTPNYRNMEFACWEGEHDINEKYTLESQGVDPSKAPKK